MANLYVFHQGIGGDGIHLWYSVFDGISWAPDTLVLDGALDLSDPPSAVAWADGISVLHQGWNRQGRPPGPGGQLWYTYSLDGTNWAPDVQVPNLGMSGSPSAVVVENGNLYVFHQGSNEDGQLWYTYFDGTNWAPDTPVWNLGMSSSPSAVAWAGGISVFHQGSDNKLWYTYSRDGINWDPDTLVPNVNMSGSPSAVVYNGLLYVFYQGGSGYAGQLWYAVYDGTNWGQNIVHHVGMSGSPSAVAWAGGMTVFHQGFDLDEQLWYSYFNGTKWETDTQVQNVGISGSPSCVVV
jgi:hypothetical protein